MIDEGRVNGVWNVGTSTWVWKYGIREKMHLSFSTFSSTDSFQLVSGIMHARLVGCRPTMKTVKKKTFFRICLQLSKSMNIISSEHKISRYLSLQFNG